MKTKDIIVGQVYFDAKVGVREVISYDPNANRLTYRLLAAMHEHVFSAADQKMVCLVGTTSACGLASFG